MRIKLISGWGNSPKILSKVFSPSNKEEVAEVLNKENYVCPSGNGRSYGDAGLNHKTLSSKELSKIIHFDSSKGIIKCESGVLLDDILKVAIPKGWFLGVTPGTKFVSIGGAIASDIHGKNHHVAGCFSNFVEEFVIHDGTEFKTCSNTANQDLFNATFGAMGQTGFIYSATIRLIPIQSNQILGKQIQLNSLSDMMKAFEENASATYSVAWLDCLAKGENLGRGVLSVGEHSTSGELKYNGKKGMKIPGFFPGILLNKITIGLFNKLYFWKGKTKELNINYEPFFYPLDGLTDWNNIYGKGGFIQYQFVLPLDTSKQGLEEIIQFLSNYKTPPFLTVLKLFGKANPNTPHSFPSEGYTLAMDFKWHDGIRSLGTKLDELVTKHKGSIYLAKDALSSSTLTPNRIQTNPKFKSLQCERLDL